MTNTKMTLEQIFKSELFQEIEAEENKALAESGWTIEEIQAIAGYIIAKSK